MLMLFLTVALVHIVALMSPGPDFFFVSQTAVSRSRKEAMMGVLGITMGVMVWAAVAAVTPAEPGRPWVATPEPAAASRPSSSASGNPARRSRQQAIPGRSLATAGLTITRPPKNSPPA